MFQVSRHFYNANINNGNRKNVADNRDADQAVRKLPLCL